MTDLELTRLCAEAMGYKTIIIEDKDRCYACHNEHQWVWSPLHDDAQVMALVRRYPLECCEAIWQETTRWSPETRDQADLNRAICECVARKFKELLGKG